MLRSPLLLLAVCLAATATSAPAQSSAPAAAPSDNPRPGDIVRLTIWREPDMSGEFRIDENGVVVLPRLGRMRVVDDSPEVLERKLVREYERFLQHSSIDVTLLRRVQVLGAVRNPGLYPVDATMSVADALALAGGATSEGNPRRVQLVRDGERIGVKLNADTPLASAQIRSGDQLFVPERSWYIRNSGVVAAALTATTSLIIAFVR